MRLVVDTGLHAFGWSREQALGYKIGEIAIRGMRDEAERELGDRFDLKAWHSMVLRGGALPLDVLAERNASWIEAQRAAD